MIFYSRILVRTLIATFLVSAQTGASSAGEIAKVLDVIGDTHITQKRTTLRDLGIDQPIVLTSSAASREIYFPVPEGLPLDQPFLSLDGNYIRANGGHMTYTLALDGDVVAARSPNDEQGDVDIQIGVDGHPRSSGAIRVGLNWSSSTGQLYCDEDRSIGNALRITPDSWLEYGFDPRDVKTISSAWSMLPRDVSLMVASDVLDEDSFAAAWRLGITLERAGKKVDIVTLPSQGDEIDTRGIIVPPELAAVPAFANLGTGSKITLRNQAEIGALLLLGGARFQVNAVVADAALTKKLAEAIDAVRAELVGADADAGSALDKLISERETILKPVDPKAIEVRLMAGRPVIAVAPDAATSASEILGGLWQKTAISAGLIVTEADKPNIASDHIPLIALDQHAGSLDVTSRSEWAAAFDLSAVMVEGKIPSQLQMYVSSSPGATSTSPVASVFINDYLLGARRLTAEGQPERISVRIPPYVLQPRNTVRVQFQRQPASDQCREEPQGYPVSVLPNSNLVLSNAPKARDFSGIVPQLTGESEVFAPRAWTSAASRILPFLIRVSVSAGISPNLAQLQLRDDSVPVSPAKPFLAFDMPIEAVAHVPSLSNGRIVLPDGNGNIFYDVTGNGDQLAVLQAVTDIQAPGIAVWGDIDLPLTAVPSFTPTNPFLIKNGGLALIGAQGVLTTVDIKGPSLEDEGQSTIRVGDEEFTWGDLLTIRFWEKNMAFTVTLSIILAFAIFLFMSKRARKRHAK